MKRKRKRKIKWQRVLILIFSIMIVIGGISVFKNINKKENKIKNTNEYEKVNANLKNAPKNHQEFETLEDGEYLTSKGYTLKISEGIATIDGNLIVNKTFSLKEDYKPQTSEVEITQEKCNSCLEKEVMESFKLMQSDAKALGLNIYIASGYRSYSYQEKLYNNYTAVSGTDGADTYSARPGHSEHQTGLCFDLNSVEISFADTDEGKWIDENAYLYGFIIRYPSGKENITGYSYEPWHLRYVGTELSSKLYQNGNWLTIEEYYGISSEY